MTTGHWKIWKIPRRKKLASSLNNGKIWDFYSLQSNYVASKRAHHNKFYFLQLRQTSEHEDTNNILHEV